MYHVNLGESLWNLEEYKETIESHEKALNIIEPMYGETNPVIGSMFFYIGRVYYDSREYQKSFGYYIKAFEVWKYQPTFFLVLAYSILSHVERYRKKRGAQN